MAALKIAISIDEKLVRKIDRMVREHIFSNRSKAIQCAVEDKINNFDKNRLARECAKLDKKSEQILAEEGFSAEIEEWPEY